MKVPEPNTDYELLPMGTYMATFGRNKGPNPMADIPEYKLKIFVDALQDHMNKEPISSFAEDDLAAFPEATQFLLGPGQTVLPELVGSWNKEFRSLYDESGDDIAGKRAGTIDGRTSVQPNPALS